MKKPLAGDQGLTESHGYTAMPPQSDRRKPKPNPRRKNSADSMKPNKGAIVIESLWTFLHLCLLLQTSSILNSLLFPVYGSLPGSRYHQPLTLTAFFLAGGTHRVWRGSSQAWSQWLSFLLLSIPTLQLYLLRFSGQLGASTGPMLSGILTCFPLTWMGALVANKRLAQKMDEMLVFDGSKYTAMGFGMIPQIITTLVSLVAFRTANLLARFISGTFVMKSRLASYYLLAIPQSLISPSKYLFLAALPLLHTIFFSVYSPLPFSNTLLNSTLQQHGYSLIARQESLTGYISVLDNNKDGFRVMRCDHSLLGGEWFPQPGYETQLREPIYAIFVMLEAVRLVQLADNSGTHEINEHSQKSALVMYVHLFASLDLM